MVEEFTNDRGTFQYVSTRLFFKGDRGDWLPTKKGCTLRRSEIHEVGKALKAALETLNEQDDGNRFARNNRQPTAPKPQPEPTSNWDDVF